MTGCDDSQNMICYEVRAIQNTGLDYKIHKQSNKQKHKQWQEVMSLKAWSLLWRSQQLKTKDEPHKLTNTQKTNKPILTAYDGKQNLLIWKSEPLKTLDGPSRLTYGPIAGPASSDSSHPATSWFSADRFHRCLRNGNLSLALQLG